MKTSYRYFIPVSKRDRIFAKQISLGIKQEELQALELLFDYKHSYFSPELAQESIDKILELPELSCKYETLDYTELLKAAKLCSEEAKVEKVFLNYSIENGKANVNKEGFIMEYAQEIDCETLIWAPQVLSLHLDKEERFLIVLEEIVKIVCTKRKAFVCGFLGFFEPFILNTTQIVDILSEWIQYTDMNPLETQLVIDDNYYERKIMDMDLYL